MLDLSTSTSTDVITFGKNLWSMMKRDSVSFEHAAQLCVEALYKECIDAQGKPAFALVRLYRLSPYRDLLPELQEIAAPQPERWLTLMATIGDEKQWCNRRLSQGHQVIPIGATLTPMLKAAFAQLGFKGMGQDAPTELLMQEGSAFTRFFYVENAVDSPYIPAQKDFVKPYSIQSVIGLGTVFSTGNACILVAFSKVPLGDTIAHAIAGITPYFTSPLAAHEEHHKLWQ